MTVPLRYGNTFIPVKYFLVAYRALSDGRTGIMQLEEHLQSSKFMMSEWKIIWIGACTLLRTSIDLFKVDARSCINEKLREEIRSEWASIDKNRNEHSIFWEFLQKERNNILHEYEWAAYQAWMEQDGSVRPDSEISLIEIRPQDARSVLIMRGGHYKNRDSLDLLKESAAWAEARIFGAIRRAGFEPDEQRNLVSFEKRPAKGKGLLDT